MVTNNGWRKVTTFSLEIVEDIMVSWTPVLLSDTDLLCVSCRSANEFSAILFLQDQAQILLDHFNVLDELRGEISTGFNNR